MANSTALIPLSASTQGEPIKVGQTGTPGTLIHTTGTSASVVDRIFLWANNTQAAATASTVLVTIEWGAATAPDFNIIVPIPGQGGLVQVIDGLVLQGNGSVGLTVRVFAATTNVINITGVVLRVTP